MIKFITGNIGKLKEVKSILGNVESFDLDLPEIQELDSKKVIEAKLLEALKYDDGPFMVEDTSVVLDCLNDLPGPLIKWFLKSLGLQGIYDLTKKYDNFNAKAIVMIGYIKADKKIEYFKGEIKGKIVSPKGEGFGWDPIFQPEGFNKTFGEMNADEKNKISMRRIALDKLKDFLKNN